MQRSAAVRIASAMLAGTALALAVACRDHDATRPVAPASSGASAARGSGAIWTTIDDCVTTQDANHYAVGHVIVINTSDFDPGTYAWSIAGNPGGSSGDPGATVASGTLTIGSSGAATGVTGAIGGLRDPGSHQACFYAYRVRADDWGEYRFAVGGKNDNYRVDGLIDVAKTATVGWTRTYEWTIAKSVRPTRMDLFSGETAIFSYAVQLTRSTLSDAYGVTGTITANNTNTTLPALVDVVDCLQVSVAGVWTNVPGVPCIPVATTLPPGVSTLPYTFANVPLDQANTYRNQVTIDGLISATAPVTFPSVPSGETNGTVHVTDTNGLSWTVSTSATETYTKTVSCPADHSGYGGHEVANTATITETGQASSAEAYYSCNGLTVTKTAATAQTRTWNWTVAKAVTPTSATVAPGQSLLLDYAIVYDATAALSDFAVTGTIHIANSNTARAATLVEVADALAGGIAATVSCPATSVPAGGALDCTYAALVPDGSTRVNTATVLQQLYTFDADGVASPNGTDAFTATATASFSGASTTVVDACTAISDTYGDSGLPTSICVDGGVPRRFAYSRSILFDPGVCGPQQVVNTAAFNTNERHVVGRSTATSTITVQCQTGCTLTQGYWKTHSLAGPAPYDDNWASVGGSSSMFAFGLSYLTVFTTPPAGGNAWYQLAHQYIAAVLNVNNGASTPPTVSAAIASANSLFANPLYTPAYIGALKANNALRMQYNNLAGILGSYNEGSVGPGHCTEDRRSAP